MPNGEAVCNSVRNEPKAGKTKAVQGQEKRVVFECIILAMSPPRRNRWAQPEKAAAYFGRKIQSRKLRGQRRHRTAYDIIVNEMKMLGGNDDYNPPSTHRLNTRADKQPAAPAAPVEDIDG